MPAELGNHEIQHTKSICKYINRYSWASNDKLAVLDRSTIQGNISTIVVMATENHTPIC